MGAAQVISFSCVLKNKLGQTLGTSFNREVLTSINKEDAPLQGLSQALQDLKPGEKRTITLTADKAYGFYDPKKVIQLPREQIPNSVQVRVGEAVTIVSGEGDSNTYKIIQIHGDMFILDGNHPLAGQDLIFEIEATEAREATPAEIFEAQNLVSVQLLH